MTKDDAIRWMRIGFELAVDHVEISETDGWIRISPTIDADEARRVLQVMEHALTHRPERCPRCKTDGRSGLTWCVVCNGEWESLT